MAKEHQNQDHLETLLSIHLVIHQMLHLGAYPAVGHEFYVVNVCETTLTKWEIFWFQEIYIQSNLPDGAQSLRSKFKKSGKIFKRVFATAKSFLMGYKLYKNSTYVIYTSHSSHSTIKVSFKIITFSCLWLNTFFWYNLMRVKMQVTFEKSLNIWV